MKEFKNLKVRQTDAVALVEINRPQKLNCFDMHTWTEMDILFKEIQTNEGIRCVVITGAGPHFSAGIDLSVLGETSTQWSFRNVPWLQSIHNQIENLPQPVIAAVNGVCIGAGMELILACDIRLSATNSSFSIPEVKLGLSPDMGGSQRLTRVVGPGQAKRLILGCETIDAREAARIGLIDELTEPDLLIERALQLADKIAGYPPLAVRIGKRAVNVAMESSLNAGLLFEQMQSVFCLGTRDKDEAVQAFFEKRTPQFEGK